MSLKQLIATLDSAKQVIEPGQEIEVDLFRPDDALGIALAYYEIYGDSFPIEHVYDPEEIIRRNATDNQYTVVARTPRNEIVGVAGLFRHAPNPGVYEAGQLMVLKAYRANHTAAKISEKVMNDISRDIGMPVLFGEAVCNHPISQRLSLQHGMLPCGLEMECMPSKAYAGEGGVTRNVSLMLFFKVATPTPCAVCLPEEYAPYIESLYADFGLDRHRLPGQPLSGITEKTEFTIHDASLTRLTVAHAGEDFAAMIDTAQAQFGNKGIMQVYLNLGDETAQAAVTLLREKGYFFGGLLPHWFGPDGMIMQKLPEPPDWDGLKLYKMKTKAVFEFVRQDFLSMHT